jgi:hypothetical protein
VLPTQHRCSPTLFKNSCFLQEFDDFCARIRSENLDLVIQNEKTAVQEWQEIDKVCNNRQNKMSEYCSFLQRA